MFYSSHISKNNNGIVINYWQFLIRKQPRSPQGELLYCFFFFFSDDLGEKNVFFSSFELLTRYIIIRCFTTIRSGEKERLKAVGMKQLSMETAFHITQGTGSEGWGADEEIRCLGDSTCTFYRQTCK